MNKLIALLFSGIGIAMIVVGVIGLANEGGFTECLAILTITGGGFAIGYGRSLK